MGEVNFTWKPWGTCKPEKVDHHHRAFCCLFPAALLYSITTGSFLKICHLRRPAEETSNDLWIDKEIKARYLDTIHFFLSLHSARNYTNTTANLTYARKYWWKKPEQLNKRAKPWGDPRVWIGWWAPLHCRTIYQSFYGALHSVVSI